MWMLLGVFLACKGGAGDRTCPKEDIVPTERCGRNNEDILACASCDPSECTNCPVSWRCSGADSGWVYSGYTCDCITDDGDLIRDSMCNSDISSWAP